jgi:hypothetical protein
LSTDEEIAETFNAEIIEKSKQVLNKSGIFPFIENLNGFTIEHLHKLDEEDLILLAKIYQQEGIDGD